MAQNVFICTVILQLGRRKYLTSYWLHHHSFRMNILNPERHVTKYFTVSFIKCEYFLHLVKVVRDAFEDKCQIWNRFSEAKLWFARPARYFYCQVLWKRKKVRSRRNIFQHNEKSSEYKKRLPPRCIHHFKPDLINNMDHMRISGKVP